jgi:hypothetical protein
VNNISGKRIFSTGLLYANNATFKTNASNLVPQELIMGAYNASIDLVWNSTFSNSVLNSTATNATLPQIFVKGEVLVSSSAIFLPGNDVYVGQKIQLLTGLVIETNNGTIPVNHSFLLSAGVYHSAGNTLLQNLSFQLFPNNTALLEGRLDSNLARSVNGSRDYYVKLEVMLNSTGAKTFVKSNTTSEYQQDFAIVGGITVLTESIQFISGGDPINPLKSSVIIINFQVINDNNESVGYLNINATFKREGGNESLFDGQIVSLTGPTGSSYQITFETVNLVDGEYTIKLASLTAVEEGFPLGEIKFSIVREAVREEALPEEALVASGLFLIAVASTLSNVFLLRKRK